MSREEPTYLKNLLKRDSKWSTNKKVIVWAIYMVKNVITLLQSRREKLLAILSVIPH